MRAARGINSLLNGSKLLCPKETRQDVPRVKCHLFWGQPVVSGRYQLLGGTAVRRLYPGRRPEGGVVTAHRSTRLCLGLQQRQGWLQVVLQYCLQHLKVLCAVAKSGLATFESVPDSTFSATSVLGAKAVQGVWCCTVTWAPHSRTNKQGAQPPKSRAL